MKPESASENTGTGIDKKIYRMQAEICRTLADPIRLELLDNLKEGERTVTELVEATGLRQANVSQHLAVMRQAELVTTRRQGITIYYSLTNPAIIQACTITKQILLERLAEAHKFISTVQLSQEN
ncbi:MAG: winged helix-turn-helix transcriptional regulator [Chloroflexi bacterium]|uniref:Metalloregulator ArsR/SmtB family transcription factor n=1 Tax=Candidatus Chlorohelix allophototropha TaxID=3003348 RepID=A0A8T7LTF0_9CHLR|nr:winged helix-turn-helix transcriptional regulator [Chloroflexota bacterium]WJW67183.1 metalloregulator ArsR/SmtB family transcription factor [Chloroflexota bacterium L227-S17]